MIFRWHPARALAMSALAIAFAMFPSVSLAETSQEKDHRTSRQILDRALLESPNDSSLLMAKVNSLIVHRDYDTALKICADQLPVAPIQAMHPRSDYELDRYSSVRAAPTRGNWLCRKAEIEFELKRFEDALKNCEASLGTYCEERSRAYFLKCRILFAMGRVEESRRAFQDGAYLAYEASSRDRYLVFQYMRNTALEVGIRKDCIKESVDSFVDGYAAENIKPRTEHADDLIEQIYQLAHLKAPDSVADLNRVLKAVVTGENNRGHSTFVLFAPCERWRSAYFVKDKSPFARNELNLQPDILFACVGAEKIRAKFGEPYRSEDFEPHANTTGLRYILPDHELNFSFKHSGRRALMNVQILWNSDAYNAAMGEAKANREKREAAEGIESGAIIQSIKQLVEMKFPTKETVESLFAHKLNPLRKAEPKSWCIGYENPNYNGPIDTDYQLTFAPNGSVDSDAQLVLRPGMQNHKVQRQQLESLFPCTTDGGTPTSKPTTERYFKLGFQTQFGSVTIECDNEQPGSPVERILFWWRGNATAQTLEEFERVQTVDALVTEADKATSRCEFERARFLLDKAFSLVDKSAQKARALQFEKFAKVREGYLNLFTAIRRPGEVGYLKRVSCMQMRGDLLEPGNLSIIDGGFFPTVDQLKGRWIVRKHSSGSSLECRKVGMLMARNLEDETAIRKLCPYGSDGSTEIPCPPAQLVDSIYFDLVRK